MKESARDRINRFSLVPMFVASTCTAESYRRVGLGLTEVPNIPNPEGTIEVDLKYNLISTLMTDDFKDLNKCTDLDLDNNRISTIETGAFHGLNSLRKLMLCYNKFTELNHGMFQGLQSLELLILTGNKISHISDDTFSEMPKLYLLAVSNNFLQILNPTMFTALPVLEYLFCYTNKITRIVGGTFLNLTNLKDLNLRHNKLTTIRPAMFEGLISLKMLKLDSNKISAIEPYSFRCLPQPIILSLCFMRSGDDRNRLVCNTSICWLKRQENVGSISWGKHKNSAYKPCYTGGMTWDGLWCPQGALKFQIHCLNKQASRKVVQLYTICTLIVLVFLRLLVLLAVKVGWMLQVVLS